MELDGALIISDRVRNNVQLNVLFAVNVINFYYFGLFSIINYYLIDGQVPSEFEKWFLSFQALIESVRALMKIRPAQNLVATLNLRRFLIQEAMEALPEAF